ncbi:MAG: hypothetical protein JWO81_1963 [Alphaproteobacteria bacterium]|nr:hypothetical protein [Alphaproteobacteria bacterium]
MFILILLVFFAYMPICMSLICRKMGYPVWIGILTVIPWVGSLLALILLWYAAFAKWPRWEEAGLE